MNLRAKIDEIKANIEAKRIDVQLNCDHTGQVYEHKSVYHSWLPSTPDWRVCEACGFAERGWGCGYQILTDDKNIVNDDKAADASRVGPAHANGLFVRVGDCLNKAELYRMAVTNDYPEGVEK